MNLKNNINLITIKSLFLTSKSYKASNKVVINIIIINIALTNNLSPSV